MTDRSTVNSRDRYMTLAMVPLAFVIAASLAGRFWGTDVSRWISSLLFTTVLLAYAGGSGPGRRSGVGSYLLGGLILFLLFGIAVEMIASTEAAGFDFLDFLFLVGFAPQGGADAPLIFAGLIWWISLMICIGLVVLLRSTTLFFVLGRTSLGDSGS